MAVNLDERAAGPPNGQAAVGEHAIVGRRRRWLLALDPVFEAGRQGRRAKAWDVEDELVAVALLGDVTIDLSDTRSAPAEISIDDLRQPWEVGEVALLVRRRWVGEVGRTDAERVVTVHVEPGWLAVG